MFPKRAFESSAGVILKSFFYQDVAPTEQGPTSLRVKRALKCENSNPCFAFSNLTTFFDHKTQIGKARGPTQPCLLQAGAGQRPVSCGGSFAVSRVFGYFLPHKK
jgi:hypothetical protein